MARKALLGNVTDSDLRLLRVFRAVVACGGFAAAELELNINRSAFYKWYRRYQEGGFEALANLYRSPKQFWNAIPPWEKQRVVETALDHPEKSPRELAWYITDKSLYYRCI